MTAAKMARHGALALALASASLITLAQADAALIFPVSTLAPGQLQSEMQLSITAADGDSMSMVYTVVPLSVVLNENQTQTEQQHVMFQGNLTLADATNYRNISGADVIPYLSCDQTNNSFIQPNTIVNQLITNSPQPAAILLYSQEEQGCGLAGQELAFNRILTVSGVQAANDIENITMNSTSGSAVRATITGNLTSNEGESDGSQSGGGNNNSTITMSVLYSITAIVSILFIGIIGMGALRARRYPERYGPRPAALGGGARQSRAKGLARAVLETLPIVKFGGEQQQQQQLHKPGVEVELENASDMPRASTDMSREEQGLGARPRSDSQSRSLDATESLTEPALGSSQHTESPMHNATTKNDFTTTSNGGTGRSGVDEAVVAANNDSNGAENDEALTCSICTEDFHVGEDMRVLPCHHKFHPQCVDPWLVNVSGTCPLCRLDLRSGLDDGSGARSGSTDTDDVPPLSADGSEPLTTATTITGGASSAGGDDSAASTRRRSRFFDITRLRHASAEERIEGLRRFRHGSLSAPSSTPAAIQGTEAEMMNRTRLSDRLRERFRVRTRAA